MTETRRAQEIRSGPGDWGRQMQRRVRRTSLGLRLLAWPRSVLCPAAGHSDRLSDVGLDTKMPPAVTERCFPHWTPTGVPVEANILAPSPGATQLTDSSREGLNGQSRVRGTEA